MGDFNADGHPDLLCNKTKAAVGGTPGVRANLMVETTSSLGATTQVSYRPSTDFPNTPGSAVAFPTVPASGVQYVAVEKTVHDGRGGASTSTYYYAGGKSDRAERRFLGFAYRGSEAPRLGVRSPFGGSVDRAHHTEPEAADDRPWACREPSRLTSALSPAWAW